jgi:hypothetical protein
VTDVGIQALIDGPVSNTLTKFKFVPKNFADAGPDDTEFSMESDEEDESTPGAGEGDGDNAGSRRVSKKTLDKLKDLCSTNKLRTC